MKQPVVNLADRVEAHRNGCVDGYTKQYGVHMLVYFEVHAGMYEAIQGRRDSRSGTARGRSG
jgi:putative endonuclease